MNKVLDSIGDKARERTAGETPAPLSPRAVMAERLPAWLQPLLTWITAQPAPGVAHSLEPRPGWTFLAQALIAIIGGAALTIAGALTGGLLASAALIIAGLLLTTGGFGIFQVVVLHHTAHGTFLKERSANHLLGRLTSAIFLFLRWEDYQREHMRHHSPKVLFTEDDEFAKFVFLTCRLVPGVSHRQLWARLIAVCLSPIFHLVFLWRRVRAAWFGPTSLEPIVGLAVHGGLFAFALATNSIGLWLLAWVFPIVVLLQIATVFRIVIEHRVPEADPTHRNPGFVKEVTVGAFAGDMPPAASLPFVLRMIAWTGWWLRVAFYHLPTRVAVLVGDASAHDFHHRHPASRKWTRYIEARDADRQVTGAEEYLDSWSLHRAIDEALVAIARSSSALPAPAPVRRPRGGTAVRQMSPRSAH